MYIVYREFPDVHLPTADRNSTHRRFWLAVGIHYVEYTRNLIINKCEGGDSLLSRIVHGGMGVHSVASIMQRPSRICVQKRAFSLPLSLSISLPVCMYIYICLRCRKHPLCSGILEARIVYCAGIGATPLYMLASLSSCPTSSILRHRRFDFEFYQELSISSVSFC